MSLHLDPDPLELWKPYLYDTLHLLKERFGFEKLAVKINAAQRERQGQRLAVHRHHLLCRDVPIGYVETEPGKRPGTRHHLRELAEAPHWVYRLCYLCLQPTSSSWGSRSALPSKQLQLRYAKLADQVHHHTCYRIQGSHVQVLDTRTDEVLWTFPHKAPFEELLRASKDVTFLLGLWEQKREAHFQQLLGA